MKQAQKEINSLKREIDTATKEKSEASGALKAHLSTLKESFGLKNLTELEKEIEANAKKLENIKTKIRGKMSDLKEVYEW